MRYNKIVAALPKKPEESKYGVWACDDNIILCATAEQANHIANFLEEIGVSDCCTTGFYDPIEDAASGTVDACTGWHYVDC